MSRSPHRKRRRGRPRPENGWGQASSREERSPGPESRRENANGRVIEELRELSPFSVFCSLYLGITDTNGYKAQAADAVARHFGLDHDGLAGYLAEQRLRREDLERARFDLESARLDMRVAPDGISRIELARTLWKELLDELRS